MNFFIFTEKVIHRVKRSKKQGKFGIYLLFKFFLIENENFCFQ